VSVFEKEVEVETPTGKKTVVMKALRARHLPKYWRLIKKQEGKKPEEISIDEEDIQLAVELIDVSLTDSVPNEDERDFIIAQNFFPLLDALYELNMLGVRDEAIEKIKQRLEIRQRGETVGAGKAAQAD